MDPNHPRRDPQSAQSAPRELGQPFHHGQLAGGTRTPFGQRENQPIPKWIVVGLVVMIAALPYLALGGKAPFWIVCVGTFVVLAAIFLLKAFCNNLFKGGN